MDVRARWLGDFVLELTPGDIFISNDEPEFLGFRLDRGESSVNTLVLAALKKSEQNFAPGPRYYEPDTFNGLKVRRLGPDFRLEPAATDITDALVSPKTRAEIGFAFAVSDKGALAIHYRVQGVRFFYDLKTGKKLGGHGAILLPPQRLLWMDEDDAIELCSF